MDENAGGIEHIIICARDELMTSLAQTCLVDTAVGTDGIPDYVDDRVMPIVRELVTALTGYTKRED